MAVKYLMFKVVNLALCLVVMASPNEESTLDVIEHVLRIPNPEKVLNSVLGRLEKSRQNERISRDRALSDEVDCNDPFEYLPEYTESMQVSRERDVRQTDMTKYFPICHTERKIRRLNTNDFEYRPAYYEEVRCAEPPIEDLEGSNEICSSLGFSCIQWNKTIHLTRRRYSSDCWETRTMVIPAGCECMWPFHRLGDINRHT